MKVPGQAWLDFQIKRHSDKHCTLVQTAYYEPSSFWGILYWFALIPIHFFVFRGMARGIVHWAEQFEKQISEDSKDACQST